MTFGLDAGAKDTRFAPRPLRLTIGPTVSFAPPAGFVDVSLLACNETTNDGIVSREVDFDTTGQLGALWGVPFTLGTPAGWSGWSG